MKVVGTASSTIEAIECTVRTHPDIVLMDLELRDGSGIVATRRLLAAAGGGVKVVMLSESHDPQTMLAAIRAGPSATSRRIRRPTGWRMPSPAWCRARPLSRGAW